MLAETPAKDGICPSNAGVLHLSPFSPRSPQPTLARPTCCFCVLHDIVGGAAQARRKADLQFRYPLLFLIVLRQER